MTVDREHQPNRHRFLTVLSWAVIVLGAVGIGVVPTMLIDRHPQWFADRLHRSLANGAIAMMFFAPIWTQMRRLRALRDPR